MSRSLNPWLLVAALWVVAALNYLDRQIIFSMLPLVRDDLKLSSVELGLIGTAFLWVYALLSPVCGFLADRFGRRRAIGLSLLIWSLVTWLTGQARTLPQLLTARGVMGVSEAFYLPAALALIVERHPGKTRSLATGIHMSGIYAGLILGGAGGWLGQHYGWRASFAILGLAGVAYVVALFPALRLTPEAPCVRRPEFLLSLRELARTPGFPAMLTVFMATAMANWVIYSWLPLYLYERFHMSLAAAGFYTIYVHASSVAGILAGGWLADRWGSVTRRGRVFTQVVGVAASGPALFLIGFATSETVLTVALIAFGLGKGFYDCNVMPVLAESARGEVRATGYGILNLGGCLIGGVVTPAAGYLKSTIGIEGTLQAVGVILLVSVLCLFRIPAASGAPVAEEVSA